jgi:3-oxoacyl-[acyl-carrier-protein] synthase II/nodulation protein E
MQRVVITGMGCITPIGSTPEALWQSLESGRPGITPLVEPDPLIRFKTAGQLPSLDLSSLNPSQLQTAERCSQLGILAARQAANRSQLAQHHDPAKIAILLGCSTNGRQAEEPEIARVYTQNARVHPLTIPRSMASNGASQVAIDQHITGPAITISTACASGAHAIGLAFHMIRSGMVTAALAGAHEAPLTKAFLRAWDSMRVVSPTSCRPFSADRDGMTLAEGAAILSLETLASARARNAPIVAEILGFGMATDAHHITQPRSEGPAQAMLAALHDAAATLQGTAQPGTAQSLREEMAYINAHATGTPTNDAVEAAALHAVFGARTRDIPVSGTKGFHGHSLGASSAIETLITALALHHRRLPLTAGTTTLDPTLNLDVILNTPRPVDHERPILALTNSLAFGGLNAILCLRSYPHSSETPALPYP